MNAKLLWLKLTGMALILAGFVAMLTWWQSPRQGIDIKGGHSLIFEIRSNDAEIENLGERKSQIEAKLAGATSEQKPKLAEQLAQVESELARFKQLGKDPGDLAQQMISVLKRRIDPDGLLSLEWRPLDNYRIEIRMPAGSEKSSQHRSEYFRALDQLDDRNISRTEIRSVFDAAAPQRPAMAEELAAVDPDQARRFTELLAARNAAAAAEQAYEAAVASRNIAAASGKRGEALASFDQAVSSGEASRENSQVAYEVKLDALRKGNVSRVKLQAVLGNYIPPSQKGKIGSKGDVRRRKAVYDDGLEGLRKFYPARAEEITKIDELYRKWADVRQRLDDPSDLQRLIAKAGVLEYRIAPYDIGASDKFTISPQLRSRCIASLQDEGPDALRKRNEQLQWFAIHEGVGRKSYSGLVVEEYAGKNYVLLYHDPAFMMLNTGPGGWSLRSAKPTPDQSGRWGVGFTFDSLGAKLFGKLTSANIERRMAVLLDDEVYSAPVIQSVISSEGIITGNFKRSEVDDLVRTLMAGSLPARLNTEPVSANTFGPRIGAVNRDKGIKAAYWGLIAVAIFMLFYYLLAGAIANVALFANLILVLGTMTLIEAVFTLPGIAGVILTIGIAVDANVLIFERLREEQAKVQSVRQAIKNAYDRAWSAIFDANITTLLVCLILGWAGTEEVRGFAITLGLGVGFSLFTALVLTRWIFQAFADTGLLKRRVVMLRLIGVPKINWMGMRHIFWGLSLAMVVMGIFSLWHQGGDIRGIEFSSGTQATITFRDDSLIDGGMRDDDVVRKQFIATAEKLGFKKLAATASVETQINEEKVDDFIRDYDSKDGADGAVSLAEWTGADMDGAFFAKLDTNTDGSLSREELESLPPVSFQVSTTETQLSKIRETATEAFGQILAIRTKRSFEAVSDADVPEMGIEMSAGGVMRITPELARAAKADYREELRDHVGGLLFVIDNVSPAISQVELDKRIREMREQPDFADQGRNPTEVVGLQSADGDGFTKLAVLVRPAEPELVTKPQAWAELITGETELLAAALGREEAMVARNFVGSIAKEAAGRAIFAIVASWLVIVAYLWMRFGSVRWGLGAVICLIHDVIIVVGLVAASGWLYNTWLGEKLGIQSFKIDLPMVAAILTVIGYSVNDTIVVFDRIRENRGKLSTVSAKVINASINQTLSRTLLTSGTTFLVVVIMYTIGGAGIHAFSFALLAGIIFGTYSSVAIASPLLMGFKKALIAKVTADESED